MQSDSSDEFIKTVNKIIYMHESTGISDNIIHKIFGFDKKSLNQ